MSTAPVAGTSLLSSLRPEARNAPESGIVEVVNHGRMKEGLIPLWVGEGDLPTPDFIARAANASLAAGETFYTWQRGIPDLREALARYRTALAAIRKHSGSQEVSLFGWCMGGLLSLMHAGLTLDPKIRNLVTVA
eukprot:gene1693-2285_t